MDNSPWSFEFKSAAEASLAYAGDHFGANLGYNLKFFGAAALLSYEDGSATLDAMFGPFHLTASYLVSP